MGKKLSRISAFIENLPVVSAHGDVQSTILSSGLELLGAGESWTNSGNCENYQKDICKTGSNKGNCKNYRGFCGLSKNGGGCINYPEDQDIYGPSNFGC